MGVLMILVLASFMIGLTSLLAYEVLRLVWMILPRMTIEPRLRVFFLLFPIFVVHIVCIWLYAFVYFLIVQYAPQLGGIIGRAVGLGSDFTLFVDCLYFSTITYTTLGYGDLLPAGDMRMLAGAQVLNGFILLGWTVSFTYLAMEKFWTLPHTGINKKHGREKKQ